MSFMADCSVTLEWMPPNVRFNGNAFIDVINRALGSTAATRIFNGPFPTRFLFPFARWPSSVLFFILLFFFLQCPANVLVNSLTKRILNREIATE